MYFSVIFASIVSVVLQAESLVESNLKTIKTGKQYPDKVADMIFEESAVTESGKKTKDLIFRTAIKILKEEGYDKLTVRKICQMSGTSNGSFYHFFKNKEELLAYYYTMSADEFLAGQQERMQELNLYDQMLLCHEWYIRYTSDLGVDFCMNFFTPTNRAIDPLYMHNSFFEMAKKHLEDKRDMIRDGYDPERIAKELCILAKGLIFDWSTARGSYDINEMATRLFSLYLNEAIIKN